MKPAKPLPMSIGVRRPGCLLLPHYMVRPKGWIIKLDYEYHGFKPKPFVRAGFYYHPGRGAYFLTPERDSLFFAVNSSIAGIAFSKDRSDNLFRDAESGHPVLWQHVPSIGWMFGGV